MNRPGDHAEKTPKSSTIPQHPLLKLEEPYMRKLFSYKKLSGIRPYVIVVNLILGALLTTPELMTQVFMATALQLIFEATVWTAWFRERRAKASPKAASTDTSAGDKA